jgi:hypothetical protein
MAVGSVQLTSKVGQLHGERLLGKDEHVARRKVAVNHAHAAQMCHGTANLQ